MKEAARRTVERPAAPRGERKALPNTSLPPGSGPSEVQEQEPGSFWQFGGTPWQSLPRMVGPEYIGSVAMNESLLAYSIAVQERPSAGVLVDGPAPAGIPPGPAPGREPPPRPTGAGSGAESLRLAFHGTGRALFGVMLRAFLLTLLTFGVYHFWARARVRRYLLGQTELAGDRFAYHGTGGELLWGFGKALLLFAIPTVVWSVTEAMEGLLPSLLDLAANLLFLALVAMATVGSRRYALSRTSWRGIRFSFRGGTGEFVRLFIGGSFMTGLTLGLYYPVFDVRRHAFLVSHTWFGDRRFEFDGDDGGLFGAFFRSLLLTLPTLGLCWLWYLAQRQRFYWNHTTFAGARFRSTVTGGRLLGLKAGNLLLMVATLGLAWPWTMVRDIRYTLDHLALEGSVDVGAIGQEAREASATGDALADLQGSGLDLDFA